MRWKFSHGQPFVRRRLAAVAVVFALLGLDVAGALVLPQAPGRGGLAVCTPSGMVRPGGAPDADDGHGQRSLCVLCLPISQGGAVQPAEAAAFGPASWETSAFVPVEAPMGAVGPRSLRPSVRAPPPV